MIIFVLEVILCCDELGLINNLKRSIDNLTITTTIFQLLLVIVIVDYQVTLLVINLFSSMFMKFWLQ